MDAVESAPVPSGNLNKEDEFYKKEVRLEEGIDSADLFAGKGCTFTVKQEEDLNDFEDLKRLNMWDESEIAPIGIDPDVHEKGAFKGIEHLFEEDLTGDGLMIKQTIRQGSGPIVPARSKVKIHYSIYAEGHDEPIDSTRLRSKTMDFILGDGTVINSLDIACSSMKKNEKSRFLAGHQYCFGEMGIPPRIPKKARMLIDVEVVHFIEENLINEFEQMSNDDKRDLTLEDILKLAAICREKGNEDFKKKKPKPAYNNYMKGNQILESHAPANEAQEIQLHAEKVKILLNLAQACLELGRTADCRRYAGEAAGYLRNLEQPFKLGKAQYTIYRSYMKEQKLAEAERALKEAVKHAPDNAAIRNAFEKLNREKEREEAQERDFATKIGEKLNWR